MTAEPAARPPHDTTGAADLAAAARAAAGRSRRPTARPFRAGSVQGRYSLRPARNSNSNNNRNRRGPSSHQACVGCDLVKDLEDGSVSAQGPQEARLARAPAPHPHGAPARR
jgi:hypothetical protein